MLTEQGLVGEQYNWTSSIFYFGYLVWSWPSSYLLVRLPIAKYLSACVLIWGAVVMCHAATNNFDGLMATRFFLVSPCAVVLSTWSNNGIGRWRSRDCPRVCPGCQYVLYARGTASETVCMVPGQLCREPDQWCDSLWYWHNQVQFPF